MFTKAEWIPHYVCEINPFSSVLEQNQEVKKPAQFILQRVEKESWQQDESEGKSGEKNWRERKSPQLETRKVSFGVAESIKIWQNEEKRENAEVESKLCSQVEKRKRLEWKRKRREFMLLSRNEMKG